jgi:predicted acyltransferase
MSENPEIPRAPQPARPAAGAATTGPQKIWEKKKIGQLPERLMSVDALRGFDMFWIVGAGYLFTAIDSWSAAPFWTNVRTQLTHVEWEGLRFYDLIFPLFIFIVGVSIVLSVRKAAAKDGKLACARKVLIRGALLFAVGLFYSGGLSNLWPDIRVLGVLQRIALCYTAAGLLFLFLRARWLAVISATILIGYWLLLWQVPVRDITMTATEMADLAKRHGTTNAVELFNRTANTIYGRFLPGANLANHFDFQFLPGKLHNTYWDPEGLLSTFPAVVTCLLGVLSGVWLLREDRPLGSRSLMLIAVGCLCFSAGWGWSIHFPVIKKIWSSSFVLAAGGYSMLLLGVFFQVVDVWRFQAWCRPFVWIGSNAITIYLAAQILNFRKVAGRLVGGDLRTWLNSKDSGLGEVLIALTALGVMLVFARFLYQRKVFLRL